MPISAGSVPCPPFISDQEQHRKEITRWMFRVSPTVASHTSSIAANVASISALNTAVTNIGANLKTNFLAVGNGIANDTVPVLNALSYMAANSKNVFVPSGTYLVDPFSINSQIYSNQVNFVGQDRETTIFRRRLNGSATAFITIGSLSSTVFQSGIGFTGLTIDGGSTGNGDAFAGYDIVRTNFSNCRFTGGRYAAHLFGGISISFNDCLFDSAKRGLQIEKFTSLAGGGWPNIIRVNGGEIVDNTEWGIWFNNGRLISVSNTEIENNGTTLLAAEGGIFIGANIGEEVSATDTFSIGLTLDGCWFEANKGIADIHLNSGINYIANSNFFSTQTQSNNDIKIDAGRYTIRNVNCSFSKSANIIEANTVQSGNLLERIEAANININEAKTAYMEGSFLNLRKGRVPSIPGTSAPWIQVGTDATNANPTITFPNAFGASPLVWASVINNSSTTLETPECYNISAGGFTVRKKSFNGVVISTVNYTIYWIAIGEAP